MECLDSMKGRTCEAHEESVLSIMIPKRCKGLMSGDGWYWGGDGQEAVEARRNRSGPVLIVSCIINGILYRVVPSISELV